MISLFNYKICFTHSSESHRWKESSLTASLTWQAVAPGSQFRAPPPGNPGPSWPPQWPLVGRQPALRRNLAAGAMTGWMPGAKAVPQATPPWGASSLVRECPACGKGARRAAQNLALAGQV